MISSIGIQGMPQKVTGDMAYLYGLSDFWTTLFQDKELIDGMLEVSTQQLGDAYAGFLQRAGKISIKTIYESLDSEIRLLLLADENLVDPLSGVTFRLPETFKSVRYILNRPLMPTVTLEAGVHYEISESGREITFYRPLETLGFPRRVTADGTHQFALWLSDACVDDDMVYRQFGSTVGMEKERSIGNYRAFIEGLFYLFSQGPIIDYTVAGVNLALGIPTARATEKVLAVLQDPMTGYWRILTSRYYYEIPYGFFPDIAVGDELIEGQQLTSWVELRDYVKDGRWWYNTYIPKELTGGVLLDPVTPNSDPDHLMQQYLRFNTFMVLFKQAGITLDGYYTVSEIIFRARPSHTYPVFVWSAPMGDELVDIRDDDLTIGFGVSLMEPIWDPAIINFVRDDTDTVFQRGFSAYNRGQIPVFHQGMIGDFPKRGELNAVNRDGTTVSGVGGWVEEAQEYVERDALRAQPAMGNRGRTAVARSRSTGIRGARGRELPMHAGFPQEYIDQNGTVHQVNNMNLVPLYLAHRDEILAKLSKIGITLELTPGGPTRWVNRVAVKANYDTIMVRKSGDRPDPTPAGIEKRFTFRKTEEYLPPMLHENCGMMYIPDPADLPDIASLIIKEVYQDFWSVSMVAERYGFYPTYMPVDDGDPIHMTLSYTEGSQVNRTTQRAQGALTDMRNRQDGQYDSDGKMITFDRSGNHGRDLKILIRRD